MNSAAMAVPYWRLSLFYFFYFGLLGAWLPYWPLYLEARNYSAEDIGYLAGIIMATKIAAPNALGWLADKTGRRIPLIRYGALSSCIIFSAVYVSDSFLQLALMVAGFSFFWNAILAQFEVVTLMYLPDKPERYGLIRVWGSVGFIVAVVGFGVLLDYQSIMLLPSLLLLIFIGIWLSSLAVVEPPKISHIDQPHRSIINVIKHPTVMAFFLCCFFQQVSHGPYYTFFSLYLHNHGYSNTVIGLLWSLGVLAEVIIFMVMHHLILQFSLRKIMLVSVLLSVFRWLMIAFYSDYLTMIIIAQCLHAMSFGTFHAFGIEMVRRYFHGGLEGQGMALYSGVSFGAGGAVGAIISGYLWELSALSTFVMAALASLLAFAIGLKIRPYNNGQLNLNK